MKTCGQETLRPKWYDAQAAMDRELKVLRSEIQVLRNSNNELRALVKALEERVSL